MNILLIGNAALRLAIQRNLVSFPSQIPAFTKRPRGHTQERIAKLYFSLNWTVRSICERYGLSRTIVRKLLADWRVRAVAAGFIQDIRPEELEALVRTELVQIGDESSELVPSVSEPAVFALAKPFTGSMTLGGNILSSEFGKPLEGISPEFRPPANGLRTG